MLDVLPSNEQSLHPTDSPAASNPFKFAHLSRDVSSTFGSQDVELSTLNRLGMMLYAQAKALLVKRVEMMPPPQKTRDLARSLIACEADTSASILQIEPATVRAYERLRRQLGATVGVDGFQALASRALALARSESPRLNAVQVMANGGLSGLGEVESQTDGDEDREAGIILIAQLLGLFLTFLGEATTLGLIEDLRFQVEVGTESATAPEDTTNLESDGPAMAAAFDDLLVEIDRLRKVSARIETLADKHAGMEDGLVSVAGNIRSIAAVLDVFTLIRSKAGGPQDEVPDLQTNRYMN